MPGEDVGISPGNATHHLIGLQISSVGLNQTYTYKPRSTVQRRQLVNLVLDRNLRKPKESEHPYR